MFGNLPGGETVLLHRWAGAAKNGHNQKIDTWAPPVPIPGTGVDVPATSEPRDGVTQNVRWDYSLYLPAGMSVGDRDKITVRGRECTVEEPGEPLANIFTATPFPTELKVRRVDR